MKTSKIIKQLAKKEDVSVEYIRAEMQKAIDVADWSKVGNNGMKPNSIEAAITILQKEVHKYNDFEKVDNKWELLRTLEE